MILLIDNYDSFAYNLFQMLGALEPDLKVIRNDELSVKEIEDLNPEAIILSPGPGHPREAGIMEELIDSLKGKIPMLGVCLGHQAICETLGAEIVHAKKLMHGKSSMLDFDEDHFLFKGCQKPFQAARYHSLAVDENSLPAGLDVLARAEDGEVMAIAHRDFPLYGLQFHPESILSPQGQTLLENFIEEIRS